MYEIIAPNVYRAYKMNNIDISVPNLLSDLSPSAAIHIFRLPENNFE